MLLPIDLMIIRLHIPTDYIIRKIVIARRSKPSLSKYRYTHKHITKFCVLSIASGILKSTQIQSLPHPLILSVLLVPSVGWPISKCVPPHSIISERVEQFYEKP